MIVIKEGTPIKCPGITSLHISFNYNPEIVNELKQLPEHFYDKKTKEWEIPNNYLAELLDALVYYDDVTLEVKADETSEQHYYPKLADNYRIKPFKHQLDAVEYFLNKDCGLLLDEPGLGKSASIIHLAEELHVQKGLEHCLIICGINSLKGNWESEIKKHSNLSYRVIGKKITSRGRVTYNSVKERAEELHQLSDNFFFIINVEMLRFDDVVQAIRTSQNNIDMIVVDECHKCGTSSSQQAKGLLKLIKYKHKIGLTGTPITSGPLNVYTSLRWVGIEKSTLSNFKQHYCIYGGFGGHQIIGYKNLSMLREEIAECSLRRTKDIIKDLPPKIITNEIVEMDDLHRKFYEAVKDGVKEQCTKIELNTNNTLALTTRLMQATVCPSILTEESIPPSKINRAAELAEEIIQNGYKVVIMSLYKEPLNELYTRLQQYNPLLGTGDVSEGRFDINRELFQEDPKYKVWLGTMSKSGTGLTLNAASYMICLNMPWNASTLKQVHDRIHRINNTETAFIYNLICENTVDEKVAEIVKMKQAMGDFLIDEKEDAQTLEILKKYLKDL